MNLKILLPFRVFLELENVKRIVADSYEGAFGLLPHRLDCVVALEPGILSYEKELEGEVFIAVDEGVLVKTGPDVFVSVRNAIAGEDLGKLRETAEKEIFMLNEQEQNIRSVLAKLESEFIRRFQQFHFKER